MESKPLGIHLVGGMIGELLLTFSCLMEYTHASPSHDAFSFRAPDIETFLTEMLQEDFPDNVAVLRLKENLSEKIQEASEDQKATEAVTFLSDPA